uniref:BspA family leucine-rich repeat surface protein n=1 Tax=Pelagomonas calceolata TaxID=35677 RepID=A0A7S3ZZU9_9STRA
MPWRAAKPVEEPAGTDATTMYHRIADWYNSPEGDALRAAWGAYPASPETLESWSGFVAVTNAFLDHAGPPPTAPETVQVEEEGPPVSEEPYEPPLMMEEEREAPALGEEAAAEETGVVVDWALLRTREILTNESLRDRLKRWCAGDREGLPPISTWNTSRVTDFSKLFMNQKGFNDDISAWDTSNVMTMEGMFRNASTFNQPLNDWRVDKVTNMQQMFQSASSFNQPLNNWRVDNVTDMGGMLWGASAFNQPLNDWRVDNVTNMSNMFRFASSFDQPLGTWRLRANCKTLRMFEGSNFRNSRPVKASCCAIS